MVSPLWYFFGNKMIIHFQWYLDDRSQLVYGYQLVMSSWFICFILSSDWRHARKLKCNSGTVWVEVAVTLKSHCHHCNNMTCPSLNPTVSIWQNIWCNLFVPWNSSIHYNQNLYDAFDDKRHHEQIQKMNQMLFLYQDPLDHINKNIFFSIHFHSNWPFYVP